MAIQLIGTGLVHKAPPKDVNYEGQAYRAWKVIHPGANQEPITLYLHTTPGSHPDKTLEVLQFDSAAKAREGKRVNHRILFSGHSGTLNVTPNFRQGGGVSKDKQQLVEGTVHEVNAIDIVCSTARQTIQDVKAEPDQLTATVIANCELDNWTPIIKVADGMQSPLQAGQQEAYHLRIIPENPVAKEVLHGIGNPEKPDHIPPAPGMYFLSGSLIRESKEAAPADPQKGKDAFVAWDRIALQVTTALPIELQDMKSQKETNSSVAAHTPDTNYFAAATSGEGEQAPVTYGSNVDSLLD